MDSTSMYHSLPPPRPLSSFAYSPPASFGSDDTVLESHEDVDTPFVDEQEKQRDKWCPMAKYAARRRKDEARADIDEKRDERPDSTPSTRPNDTVPEVQEWTPTCTDSLRRQWQSILLRLRLALFRAQRRAKRRFSMT